MKTRRLELTLQELASIEMALVFAGMHRVPISASIEESVDELIKKVQEAQIEIVEELECEREGK